jgi:menaquinone-dependent protoporphyrinogen oxidase
MARILVVYGTSDGHTAKVAHSIADTLRTLGDDPDVIEAGKAGPRPENYAAVVVAASVHTGGYQRSVRRWVRAHSGVLNRQPTAFVSVCLGVLQQDPAVQQELSAIIGRFLTATGWRPGETKPVAGALPYTRYNPIKRWVMKRIVGGAGGDTDTSRDYEYTDWTDLRAFAAGFAKRVRPASSAHEPSAAHVPVHC